MWSMTTGSLLYEPDVVSERVGAISDAPCLFQPDDILGGRWKAVLIHLHQRMKTNQLTLVLRVALASTVEKLACLVQLSHCLTLFT